MNNKNEVEHEFKTVKAKKVILPDNYKYFNQNPLYLMFSVFVIWFVRIFFCFTIGLLFHRVKLRNKKILKQFKKKGAVVVSNHVLQMDAFYIGSTLRPHKTWFSMLQSNLGLPFAGKLFRSAGAVPIPTKLDHLVEFNSQLKVAFGKGQKILVYPEAVLKPYCDYIRPFKSGAFWWAAENDVPVIPIVITYRKPKRRKKPYVTITFLDPIYGGDIENKYERVGELKTRAFNAMDEHFNKYSEIKREVNHE